MRIVAASSGAVMLLPLPVRSSISCECRQRDGARWRLERTSRPWTGQADWRQRSPCCRSVLVPAGSRLAWWLWLGSAGVAIYGSALPFNFDLNVVAAGQRLSRAAADFVALMSGARSSSTGDV